MYKIAKAKRKIKRRNNHDDKNKTEEILKWRFSVFGLFNNEAGLIEFVSKFFLFGFGFLFKIV